MSNVPALFWLAALPLKHREKSTQNSSIVEEDRNILYSFLKDKLSVSGDLAEVHQFAFPEFKVGTLDSLVTASEDLVRMDSTLESSVSRLVASLKGLLPADGPQLRSSLLVNDATPEAYIKSFQWNIMKYRTDRTVTEIAETLVTEVQQIDNLLKARLATYNQAKAAVTAVERKSTGSLLTKDLAPYVKAEDFAVNGSEFMTTLLVVVPRLAKGEWETSYEHLAEMVVPRSSRLLAEEDEHALYNVTVFKKVREAFVRAAGEQKFTVRAYTFDEASQRATAETNEAMAGDMKAQWSALVRLLKTNFGELFSAWIHLKVARLFVDSVLQYGLPPQFLALILKPTASKDMDKSEKRLRLAFLQHLEQLQLPGISQVDIATAIHSASNADDAETAEEAELWNALNMANRDQEPFVKVPLKWTVPS